MTFQLKNLQRFIVVGDRVLKHPEEESTKTASGLYLTPAVSEKEKIQT